eukprot:scaffold1314_cov386-Pavlova_lutheri.AAC.34
MRPLLLQAPYLQILGSPFKDKARGTMHVRARCALLELLLWTYPLANGCTWLHIKEEASVFRIVLPVRCYHLPKNVENRRIV